MLFRKLISDFTGLFYPRLCASCNEALVKNEVLFCTSCRLDLPRTNYHTDPDNEIARIFWGRVSVVHASAHFYFQKGGRIQTLLHKLKYKSQQHIGIELGKMIGRDLKNSSFNQIDTIIPVPLHKSKKRRRGYNQSECIAIGISEIMGKPLDTKTLQRAIANPTQTKKHRYERWSNVEGIFTLVRPENIANKHILLVDDVITTGATLEASALTLLQAENVKVSIITAAKA